MSEFFSVVDEFKQLIADHGFKSPRKLWYPNIVSLTRHLEGIFYCYIIARVYKSGGALETTLWVGPIDRPDDGLQNLSANIKLEIGYNSDQAPDFFLECEKKIIELIDSDGLAPLLLASKEELETPSVVNRRYQVYTKYLLPFFDDVIKASGDDRLRLGNKNKCNVIIEKEFGLLDGEMKVFFEQLGLKATQEKVWELCYIYSL